jgi:hypothetical protein
MKFVITLALCLAPSLLAQQVFTNDSILKMMTMGFSEDAIIESINRNPGRYDTSLDALIALKKAGVTNNMVAAMVHKDAPAATVIPAQASAPSIPGTAPAPVQPPVPVPIPAPAMRPAHLTRPRVFIASAVSHGTNWGAVRNQSMELSRDFQNTCPEVQVSLNQQNADYTVQLNHIETVLSRDNQIQVANRDGDLISTSQGGSIKGRVKQACNAIETDWSRERGR